MKFTIVATVLLGLVLTEALGAKITKKIPVAGGNQILTVNKEWHVATIEQKRPHASWKTIWNYDGGFVATKAEPERACYISAMNREKMPSFDALPGLAELQARGPPPEEVTLALVKRPVRDLQSYGPDIFSMCRGLTTFVAYEVNGPQYSLNQGACNRFNILQLLGIVYCHPNINS